MSSAILPVSENRCLGENPRGTCHPRLSSQPFVGHEPPVGHDPWGSVIVRSPRGKGQVLQARLLPPARGGLWLFPAGPSQWAPAQAERPWSRRAAGMSKEPLRNHLTGGRVTGKVYPQGSLWTRALHPVDPESVAHRPQRPFPHLKQRLREPLAGEWRLLGNELRSWWAWTKQDSQMPPPTRSPFSSCSDLKLSP